MNGFDDVVAVHGGQLGADIADVTVDGAIRHLNIELISGAHDLLAAEDERRPRQECPENSELDGRQAKRRAGELGNVLFGVDGQPALRQRRPSVPLHPGPREVMRRRMTFTLATSSRGLNGLVT